MGYVPNNTDLYTSAYCAALSGMGQGPHINYTQLAPVAGAFAAQIDTIYGVTLPSTLEIQQLLLMCQFVWQGNPPTNSPNTTLPASYAAKVVQILTILSASADFFDDEGITPPPTNAGLTQQVDDLELAVVVDDIVDPVDPDGPVPTATFGRVDSDAISNYRGKRHYFRTGAEPGPGEVMACVIGQEPSGGQPALAMSGAILGAVFTENNGVYGVHGDAEIDDIGNATITVDSAVTLYEFTGNVGAPTFVFPVPAQTLGYWKFVSNDADSGAGNITLSCGGDTEVLAIGEKAIVWARGTQTPGVGVLTLFRF